MADELVKRLRSMHWCVTTETNGVGVSDRKVALEAADRVKQLTAERDRLRAALAEADRRIAWEAHGFGNDFAERVEAALKGESHD